MKESSDDTCRRKTPFFWAFMIVSLTYVIVGYLTMYLFDNNVFHNDEFPEWMLAGFLIAASVFAMVVPGIAAHYVYEKARRNWYVWICPLVLILLNVPLWLMRKSCLLTIFPIGIGFPISIHLNGIISNDDLAEFMYIVLMPSIIYSICIFLARLFSRRPKAKVE